MAQTSSWRWRDAALLAFLAMVAALPRFWQLDRVPPGFHYDEAYEALEAWRVLTQPGYHPVFFPGNFGVEPMFIYLTSLAFRLFGESPAVMRGVAALVGTLTVLALYAWGRELALADARFPKSAAWLAALALAIMRWHLIFSRVGIEPILVPLFLALIHWAFWRARRTSRTADWLALGLVMGLSVYIYPAARLLPLTLLPPVLWILSEARKSTAAYRNPPDGAQQRDDKPAACATVSPAGAVAPRSAWISALRIAGHLRRSGFRQLLLAGLIALIVAAPMGWNWLQHPDQLLLRSSQIAVGPGQTVAGSPAQNLLATLGMFSVQGDRDPRSNVPGMPALDLLISVPFLIGLGLALWRWRQPVYGSLLWAGAVMLIPTIFSDYAPHFRRAVGATPVVALCIGVGLATLLGKAQDKARHGAYVPHPLRQSGWEPEVLAGHMDRLRMWGRALVVSVIVIGSTAYTAVAYFDIWGSSNALYYAYDQGLWEIGQYVRDLPADEAVYLSPRPAADMTLAFVWRAGRPVRHFDGRHAFIAPAGDQPSTFIIIEHEDFRGVMLLRDLYPAAVEVQAFRDRKGAIYARAFRVTHPAQIARQPQTPRADQWPGMRLIGYDIDKTRFAPGGKIFLQLWWRADASPAADWTVFTHLVGAAKPDGSRVWAGLDGRPGQGSVPTRTWAAGDRILDEYQISLPPDMAAGEYQLEIGLYDPQVGNVRLGMSAPAGQDHVILRTVWVQ